MKSVYNTPTVWAVYILNLVLKWIRRSGGVKGQHHEMSVPEMSEICTILLLLRCLFR